MGTLATKSVYAQYSFWLETCGDDLTPRPRLEGTIDVDVAILGAGFTGLWTAYYLLQREPSAKVVILEQKIAGFGASGRNGGWLYPGFPVSLAELASRYGVETARAIHYAMRATVDEVERVLHEEGIDAHFHRGGVLRLARGIHQVPALEETARTLERLGITDYAEWLSAEAVRERVRVTNAVAGLYSSHGAVIHPGRLVRGLARAVECRGATIFEETPVIDIRGGIRPVFRTPYGDVRARVLVLAGEAYLSQLRQFHRALIPIYSLIVLTEPIPEELWKELGWSNRELLSSQRLTVDYLQRTADGRIMFGGRGAPYRFGSRIADAFDRHGPTHEMLRQMCYEWFPMLRLYGIHFTHAWGGPLGVPRDWMPTMRYDPRTGIAMACGYTGQGVATANLAGRIVADLITGRDSELTRFPMTQHQLRPWEPEPLRWLGVRFVQIGYERLDRIAESTGRPPSGKSLVERIAAH
ncbi:FAD-binding oxidoreductase [Thermomicrobium sp. CFH 73360]|uniref:NAD(P)/FAD-dependent oxidoreductase n=1 Tax=Thermomicrobium sp. CFH 73360 TaxID=2951987 RepID=UPI0020774B5C|nr:FAD-dependent oxidoreductase [Thermomicrobium sp. CFH 73360]MCM8746391.1 FAD-binding oxidoreductase [Thermomicrobium sp. CFH 73360]